MHLYLTYYTVVQKFRYLAWLYISLKTNGNTKTYVRLSCRFCMPLKSEHLTIFWAQNCVPFSKICVLFYDGPTFKTVKKIFLFLSDNLGDYLALIHWIIFLPAFFSSETINITYLFLKHGIVLNWNLQKHKDKIILWTIK